MIAYWFEMILPLLGPLLISSLPLIIFFEVLDWGIFRKKIKRRKTFFLVLVILLIAGNAALYYLLGKYAPNLQYFAYYIAFYSAFFLVLEGILHAIYHLFSTIMGMALILRVIFFGIFVLILFLGGITLFQANRISVDFKKSATQMCKQVSFGIPDNWNADSLNNTEKSMLFYDEDKCSSICVKVLGKKDQVLKTESLEKYFDHHKEEYQEVLYEIFDEEEFDYHFPNIDSQYALKYAYRYHSPGFKFKPTAYHYLSYVVYQDIVYEIHFSTNKKIGGNSSAIEWMDTIKFE